MPPSAFPTNGTEAEPEVIADPVEAAVAALLQQRLSRAREEQADRSAIAAAS